MLQCNENKSPHININKINVMSTKPQVSYHTLAKFNYRHKQFKVSSIKRPFYNTDKTMKLCKENE